MRAVHLPTTDSTMHHARRLIEAGEPGPLCVRADQQNGGFGRHGRPWHSPPGGLWLTYAAPLRAPIPPAAGLRVALSLLGACQRAVAPRQPVGEPELRIKWPNDILFGRGIDAPKLAGCLIQVVGARNAQWVVCGIGINVNNDPGALALQAGERAATSLSRINGAPLSPGDLSALGETVTGSLAAVFGDSGRAVEPTADELAAFRRAMWGVGLTVPVTLADGQRCTGRIDGIDDRGGLRMTVDGAQRTLNAVDQLG